MSHSFFLSQTYFFSHLHDDDGNHPHTMAPSAGASASPTYLPQKQASAPSWKLDPEEYRERQVADRIVDVKSKESFSADDRLIRQYEQEVMKQFEECVNRIPTGDVRTVLSV